MKTLYKKFFVVLFSVLFVFNFVATANAGVSSELEIPDSFIYYDAVLIKFGKEALAKYLSKMAPGMNYYSIAKFIFDSSYGCIL